MNTTPQANRIHIAFFGLRNAGKSTLVNAFTNQNIAIVSDVAGTTTDPVSKAMEILPLGPCLITDTAGLDDVGELGAMRVEKTLGVLSTTDVAIWVWGEAERPAAARGPYHDEAPNATNQIDFPVGPDRRAGRVFPNDDSSVGPDRRAGRAFTNDDSSVGLAVSAGRVFTQFLDVCTKRKITVLEYHRGDSVEGLKQKIASLKLIDDTPGLLDGLVTSGDRVICVCPIDESAPKGRLILPQVQVIRDCLDRHVTCTVCQVEELSECLTVGLSDLKGRLMVITDSQAFARVNQTIEQSNNPAISLTSFSILFARQKGDLDVFLAGLKAVASLKDGDHVLIAEGCTHHRQCNDIGTTKIPKALAKLTAGKKLNLTFASGTSFPIEPSTPRLSPSPSFALVVQCGGCMLTRREMMRRIDLCRAAGIPIVNYGILLAGAV